MDLLVAMQSTNKVTDGLGEEDLWASKMYTLVDIEIFVERTCDDKGDDR